MLAFMQFGPLRARLTPVTTLGEDLRAAKLRTFRLAVWILEHFPGTDVTPTFDGRSVEIETPSPGVVRDVAELSKEYLRTL